MLGPGIFERARLGPVRTGIRAGVPNTKPAVVAVPSAAVEGLPPRLDKLQVQSGLPMAQAAHIAAVCPCSRLFETYVAAMHGLPSPLCISGFKVTTTGKVFLKPP